MVVKSTTTPNYELNWKLLHEQKKAFIEIILGHSSEETKNKLDGILSILDAIQDQAVEIHGLSEIEVFQEVISKGI